MPGCATEPTIPSRRGGLNPVLNWAICFAVLLPATWFCALRECGGDWNAVPGAQRDDVFYDNIAWQLSRGQRFSLDFQNESWLQVYRDATDGIDRQWIFQTRVAGVTTSRAPVYPVLLSLVYRTVGRRWELVRIGQVIFLPAGLALFLVWVGRRAGSIWISFVGAVTMAADFGILGTAGQLMSESPGVLLVALSLFVLDRAWQRQTAAAWCLAGLVFGVAILLRSTLVGWLVLAGGLFFVAVCLRLLMQPQSGRRLLVSGCCFFCCSAAVCMPWWVRNCTVAETFEPFGSAGRIGMAGGFCDGAVRLRGNWSLDEVHAVQREAVKTAGFGGLTLARQEHLIGTLSSARAKDWISRNPQTLTRMTLDKALNHLVLISQPVLWIPVCNAILLAAAAIGVFLSRSSIGGWILLATLLSLGTTMLTWSHYGRFSIPIRPFWHVAAAVTVVVFWQRILRCQSRVEVRI